MEIQETAPEAVIMICEQPGRKPRPLRLATIEDCDALITAATNAKWMILGAIAAVTPIDATIVDDEFCPDPHCFEPPGHEPPHMDSEGRTYGPGSDTILGPGDELSDDDDDEPGPMDDEAELRRADEIRYHGHVPSLDGTLRFCALAPGHENGCRNADGEVIITVVDPDACPAVREDDGQVYPCVVKPIVHIPGAHMDELGVHWQAPLPARCKCPATHGLSTAWCLIDDHHAEPSPALALVPSAVES